MVAAAAKPITDRPPYSTRLRTSRPRKSVPSGALLEGPESGRPIGTRGSCGAKYGPKAATSTTNTTMPNPIAPDRVRRKRSRALPRLGHEQHDDQVGEQVQHDVDDRDQHRDRLHDGDVPVLDGVHEHRADAG